MKKFFKVTLWILAFILFPLALVLYYIWPSKIKEKMSKGWKIFWWILYALIALGYVAVKLIICIFLIAMITDEYTGPTISRDDVAPITYKTSDDFYKLTGVEFPELEMVDSLFYCDNGFPSSYYTEYTFVIKGGMNKRFEKRLKKACKNDSTHWSCENNSVSATQASGIEYFYSIFPEKEPVDRTRGNCDRMVTLDNGDKVNDWEGSYLLISIKNDTIVLRDGWVH